LGARCLTADATERELALVLLEPSTEGRLAAALARHGEGPVALYAVVAPRALDSLRALAVAAGVRLSQPAPGPFGHSVLVAGGQPWGPHLLVAADISRVTIEG
jgi:hypothetical protein